MLLDNIMWQSAQITWARSPGCSGCGPRVWPVCLVYVNNNSFYFIESWGWNDVKYTKGLEVPST